MAIAKESGRIEQTNSYEIRKGCPKQFFLISGVGLVHSLRRGGRRQEVKAAACGAAIRGFESPRSPFIQIKE